MSLVAWIACLNVVKGNDEQEDDHAEHIGTDAQNLHRFEVGFSFAGKHRSYLITITSHDDEELDVEVRVFSI